MDFCSWVFCASSVCSIRPEDAIGRPSPATAELFRTTAAKIKRDEVENDFTALSAMLDSLPVLNGLPLSIHLPSYKAKGRALPSAGNRSVPYWLPPGPLSGRLFQRLGA